MFFISEYIRELGKVFLGGSLKPHKSADSAWWALGLSAGFVRGENGPEYRLSAGDKQAMHKLLTALHAAATTDTSGDLSRSG